MEDSWYVEFLIRNAVAIRSRLFSPIITSYLEPAYTMDLDDDIYNDLLIVEGIIKEMWNTKRLTEKQKLLLFYIYKGNNLSDIERITEISRITLSRIFTGLCNRIGFMLGGQFTDAGFVDYMQEKYLLSKDEILKLQHFLESNKRHTIGGTNVD